MIVYLANDYASIAHRDLACPALTNRSAPIRLDTTTRSALPADEGYVTIAGRRTGHRRRLRLCLRCQGEESRP